MSSEAVIKVMMLGMLISPIVMLALLAAVNAAVERLANTEIHWRHHHPPALPVRH